MNYIEWESALDTGIPIIDSQHRRIVDYINELHDAISNSNRDQVGEILDQLVDYTMSHFAFEETLMEEAGYSFISAHKKVHQLFTAKVADFQHRFELGEDVSRKLLTTMRTWLINHIKRDDADYSEIVRYSMDITPSKKSGFFKRLFEPIT